MLNVRRSTRMMGLALVVVLLASVAQVNAAIIGQFGTNYSLAAVIENQGIIVGDKLFDSFGIVSNAVGGAVAPDAASISVCPVLVNGNLGLRFNGGWLALQNQTVDTMIAFCVTASERWWIKDDMLWMPESGVNAANGGAVTISEAVFAQNPDVSATPAVASNNVWFVDNQNRRLIDQAEFAPVRTIWVQKNIVVGGDGLEGGMAHLSIFYQTFSQVPEPGTLALLGIGGLVLLRRRRN